MTLPRMLQDASTAVETAEKRARRERIMAAMRPKACIAPAKSTSAPVQRSPRSPAKFSSDDEEFMLAHISSAGVSGPEARANICVRARKPRMTCEMLHLFIWRFWRCMPEHKSGSYISVREAIEKTGAWVEPQNGKKVWSVRVEGVHSHAPEGHLIGGVLAFWRYNVTVAAGYGQPSRKLTVWDCELGEVSELIKNDGPGYIPALRSLPPNNISSLFAINPFTSKQGPLSFRIPSASPEQQPRSAPAPVPAPVALPTVSIAPPPVSISERRPIVPPARPEAFDRVMTEQQANMHKACQERIMAEKEASASVPQPQASSSHKDISRRPRMSAAISSDAELPTHRRDRSREYLPQHKIDRRSDRPESRFRPPSFIEREIAANQNVAPAPAIATPSPISTNLARSLVALQSDTSRQKIASDKIVEATSQDGSFKPNKRSRDVLGPAAAQSPIAFSFDPEPEQADGDLPSRQPGARLKLTDLISEEPPTKRQRMRSDISVCSISSTESLGISSLAVEGDGSEVTRAAELLIQAAWSKRTSPNKQHYHLTSAVRNGRDAKADKMIAV